MGCSSGEPSSKAIDASVGALVWVRRRNGSWWPGRIVGLDEVSEGCLVSPRSGTPVKLLGREDASIDWYNLEKSKRVKSFRCGEYDDCIEKAKAAAASSNKKAVKYARREDAILHALEIESALLSKDHPDYYDASVSKHEILDKDSPTTSFSGKEVDEGASDSLSAPNLLYSGMSFEEQRGKSLNDSEDDGMEGIKRMRGLQDLTNGQIQHKNGPFSNASAVNCMINGSSSSLKRKRSRVAYSPELLKKKNKRRTLTKVLESTVMVSVSVPVACEQFAISSAFPLGGEGTSESKEMGLDSSESKSTGLSYENGVAVNDEGHPSDNGHVHEKIKNEPSSLVVAPGNELSETLNDVPLNAEDKSSAGLTSLGGTEVGVLGRQYSQSSHAEAFMQPEATNRHDFPNSAMEQPSASKWQSKGKRNSRYHNAKKRRVTSEVDQANGWVKQMGGVHTRKIADLNSLTNGPLCMTPQSPRSLSHRQSRFTLHPRATLYDVELKVNAKSHRASSDVPLVSLMSKLNRKAIVGHPLTVEALADGSVNCLEIGQLKSRLSPSKHGGKSKKNGLMSKKMRKLSSLTGGQRKAAGPIVEKLRSPVVACIPLKLVFSRINEAVNGSLRPLHRLSVSTTQVL